MVERTLSTEEQVAAVRQQLHAVESELQTADARLTRALSAEACAAQPSGELPPIPGRPPASPPLRDAARLPQPRGLDSSAGSASSTDTSGSGSGGDAPAPASSVQERGASTDDAPPQRQSTSASSFGWIFRCVITTKAGRCIVNCAPHASTGGVRGTEGGSLAVGPLCRLLVTMHEFSQGGFLSYVQIHNCGVVLVDGGSYLVGIICAAGVDLPAVKLRAVQIRHVFGLLHQSQVDEMQARHEAEAEAMLKTYTIHSSRTEHNESAEPQTAPPFAHFEQLYEPAVQSSLPCTSTALAGTCSLLSRPRCAARYLRATLREPSLSEVWLRPLLQLQGVRSCFLVDVANGSVLLSSNAASLGSSGQPNTLPDETKAEIDFGPFLRQCWGTIFEYARILCASEIDAGEDADEKLPPDTARAPHGGSGSNENGFLGLVFDAGPLGLGGGLSSSVTLALQAVSLGTDRPACLVLVYLSTASAAEETRAAARTALARATSGLSASKGGDSRGKQRRKGGKASKCGSRRTAVRQLPAERERIVPVSSASLSDAGDSDNGGGAADSHRDPDAESAELALSGVAHARLQSEELDALPPRFRTQTETLRRLYYPSSFALRPDPAAAGLPARVGRSLAAVSQAITRAYPQEQLSMAALPTLQQGTTACSAVTTLCQNGARQANPATPTRRRFAAAPPPRPPPVDSVSSGGAQAMVPPGMAAGGRRRGAGPRARRYSDGGSALSGIGVSAAKEQPPQSVMVPRPPQQKKVNASSIGTAMIPGHGRSARFIGGRVVRPGMGSRNSQAPDLGRKTPRPPGVPAVDEGVCGTAVAAGDDDDSGVAVASGSRSRGDTDHVGQHAEQRGAGAVEETFDAEVTLEQLEWPQPIGAIRSEGELAPLPPQLLISPAALS